MDMQPRLSEEGFFFFSENRKLFVELKKARRSNKGARLVVMIDPLFEEKIASWRFQRELGKLITNKYACVFIDYYGTGDSEGNSDEFSFNNSYKDVVNVIDHIRTRLDVCSVTLVGVRIGALIAVKVAEGCADANELILIDPVLSGKSFMSDLKKKRKIFGHFNRGYVSNYGTHQGSTYPDYLGYLLSTNFEIEAEEQDAAMVDFNGRNIVIYKSRESGEDFLQTFNSRNRTNTLIMRDLKYGQFWLGQEYSQNLIKAVYDDIKLI